jgi:hypothetical protein
MSVKWVEYDVRCPMPHFDATIGVYSKVVALGGNHRPWSCLEVPVKGGIFLIVCMLLLLDGHIENRKP